MKYYSTERPIGPGSYPARFNAAAIENYDEPKYIESIGRTAWGCVDLTGANNGVLPEDEEKSYNLVPEGKKRYWAVGSSFYDNGRVVASILMYRDAFEKPEDEFKEQKRCDTYIDWFDSLDKAQHHVEEAKRA